MAVLQDNLGTTHKTAVLKLSLTPFRSLSFVPDTFSLDGEMVTQLARHCSIDEYQRP